MGPLAGIRGEVTLIDGECLVSTISAGEVRVERTFAREACFLVHAEVPRWQWRARDGILATWPALESVLRQSAEQSGIDPDGPFPFRITGLAESGTIHVLDKRDDRRHSHALHEEAKSGSPSPERTSR